MSFTRGEILWVDFRPTKGREQDGRRPALVISPQSYNDVSSTLLVCPITSNMSPWPWKVPLPEGGGTRGAVLVDQVKSIDPQARHAERAGQSVPDAVMDEIMARLRTLIE